MPSQTREEQIRAGGITQMACVANKMTETYLLPPQPPHQAPEVDGFGGGVSHIAAAAVWQV